MRLPLYAVVIEHPSSQQESGPLVPFGETLSSSDPECDCTCCGYGILEVGEGLKCCFDLIEFVRFVEPLVVASDSLVELDGEREFGPFQ